MTLIDTSESDFVLKKELETYEAHKNELLAKSKGKFVLIKGDKVIDVFNDWMDAIAQGYKQFGYVPLLVKEIVEVEIPISFSSPIVRI